MPRVSLSLSWFGADRGGAKSRNDSRGGTVTNVLWKTMRAIPRGAAEWPKGTNGAGAGSCGFPRG